MHSKAMTILRSSNEEITFAVLTCETEREMNDTQALEAFRKGITKWMRETLEGGRAWKESCEDFNIGDLSSYVGEYADNKYLHLYLEAEGIHHVEIEIHSVCQEASRAWTYDTVLRN